MSWIFSLYVAFLFFILTPAILVRLPPKGDKFTVAAFHAVVFALILHFTGKIVLNFSRSLEGFQEGTAKRTKKDNCVGYKSADGKEKSTWTNAAGNTTGNVGTCKFVDGVTSGNRSSYCDSSASKEMKNGKISQCTFN